MCTKHGIHKGHGCERANMAAKCEIFMKCSKNIIDICKKNMTAKQGILKGS